MLKIAIELFTTTFTIASTLKPVSANVEKETSKKKKKKKKEEEEETRERKNKLQLSHLKLIIHELKQNQHTNKSHGSLDKVVEPPLQFDYLFPHPYLAQKLTYTSWLFGFFFFFFKPFPTFLQSTN